MALKGGEVLSVPAYKNVRYGNGAKNARCTASMVIVGVAYNEPI
tara:strand:+ start:288 stop:419 length:132 start_codon:yes stop_codon:yes gene_type:complete